MQEDSSLDRFGVIHFMEHTYETIIIKYNLDDHKNNGKECFIR